MSELRSHLLHVANTVDVYRSALPDARVGPTETRATIAHKLDRPLQDEPVDSRTVIDEMVEIAAPGLMNSAGPRYFGFVVGGTLDASLLAEMVAAGWDQVAFNEATSPAAAAFEDCAGRWLKDLLGIPSSASVGFVTGGQGANTVGLAAARLEVLRRHGWDVGRDGLNGAPPITVFAGAERHATIDRTLRLLGIGERSIRAIPTRPDGAMDADRLADALDGGSAGPTIICAQSGNVNTGAFDDLRAIGELTRSADAWMHVDGAFGLWAAASPAYSHLVDGLALADSWACDGHKWLNLPYDSGFAFCAHPHVHATAMAYTAEYLTGQVEGRVFGSGDFVPESSRRARGFAAWAGLRSLGRQGVTDLIDRCCALARRFAEQLQAIDGVGIVNDVVLNQVLVRVGDTAFTQQVEAAIQRDGTAWLGGTVWRGERLLRISVSNWTTTERDVDQTVAAIASAIRSVRAEKEPESVTGPT